MPGELSFISKPFISLRLKRTFFTDALNSALCYTLGPVFWTWKKLKQVAAAAAPTNESAVVQGTHLQGPLDNISRFI